VARAGASRLVAGVGLSARPGACSGPEPWQHRLDEGAARWLWAGALGARSCASVEERIARHPFRPLAPAKRAGSGDGFGVGWTLLGMKAGASRNKTH